MNEMTKAHVKRLEKRIAELEKHLKTSARLWADERLISSELEKDRDSWERRARYLEELRVEGLAAPYKFGGEGVA